MALGQSRSMSLIESASNVAVGYLVALAAQLIVFPSLGIAVSLSQNLIIGLIFTAVSIARSYVMRRVFNSIHLRFQ
jgi:hypothetical protein